MKEIRLLAILLSDISGVKRACRANTDGINRREGKAHYQKLNEGTVNAKGNIMNLLFVNVRNRKIGKLEKICNEMEKADLDVLAITQDKSCVNILAILTNG